MLKKRLILALIFLIAASFVPGCGGDEATFITVLQGILTGEGSTVPGQPTTIKDSDGFGVLIPPKALPEGVLSVDVALGRVTTPQNLDTTCAIGTVRFIEVTAVNYSSPGGSHETSISYELTNPPFVFASPVTLSLPYLPGDFVGIEDPGEEIGVDTYDPDLGVWVPVSSEDVTIDSVSKTIQVNTLHFSQYVIVHRPSCTKPMISSIYPEFGPPGSVVSIYGEHFITDPFEPQVFFSNDAEGTVFSSSNHSIEAVVPEGAVSGPVRIQVGPLVSNTVDFIVTEEHSSPVISSISPESGSCETMVTLHGSYLGSDRETTDQTAAPLVHFGSYDIGPSFASFSTVIFNVPCTAPDGVYPVHVTRYGLASNTVTFEVTDGGGGTDAMVTGRVTDSGGAPIEGVTVTTLDFDFELLVEMTDSDGRYELLNVLEGQRVIAFAGPGYETNSRLTVVDGATPLSLDATLTAWTGPNPTGTPDLSMDAPIVDSESGIARVVGDLSGLDSHQAVVTNNGNDAILSVSSPFDKSVVLNVGVNRIQVRGTNAIGTTQSQWYEVTYTPTDDFIFRATLSWSEDGADMDIHAWYDDTEHCYYGQDTANLELDVDNTSGFGPENITSQPDAPDGTYYVAVNYYSGSIPVESVVSVMINPGSVFEEIRSFGPFELTMENFEDGYPITGSTDSWWRAADIVVFNGVASFATPDTGHELLPLYLE